MTKIFKKVKMLKVKITSIFLLVLLLTLEFSPFAVKATANQLQYYSPGCISVGRDSVYGCNVWYANATLGGKTAYCIDYSYTSPSGTMTFRDYLSDQGMAVLMHGYPTYSPAELGCANADEAYMATQMALWEVLNRTQESHKALVPFRVENVTPIAGKEGFYNNSVRVAKNLVAMAQAEPYTSSPKLVIDESRATAVTSGSSIIAGPFKATLNGVDSITSIRASVAGNIPSARITDANGNAKTSIANGEDIYVTLDMSESVTSVKVNYTVDYNRKVGCIYERIGQSAQDYVMLDTEAETLSGSAQVQWVVETTIGRLELVKVDQDNEPVVGALFELKDTSGKSYGRVSTGSDGKIMFVKVPVGDYILEEIEAPEGYVIKDRSTNVTVVGGECTTKKIVNERITGKLIITKVDDENAPIANVTFEIYDEEGYVVKRVTTDASGKASVNLDYGRYYLKEVSAPAGYIMDTTLYTFKVDAENRVFNKTIVNKKERVTGNLLVVKKDDQNTPIQGVEFKVYNSKNELYDTIVTDENGLAGCLQMPAGKYYVVETKAPDNYIMDTTAHNFEIKTQDQIARIDVVNEKIKGSLKITKVNDDDRAIANVKFNILDAHKNVVETVVTGENGIATSKQLEPGTYYYKEVEVPNGYILDSQEYKFEIKNDNKLVAVKVVNHYAKGQLRITKYTNNGDKLSGVEFDILDQNKKVVDHIVTNEKGVAVSKELVLGTYYYKETTAPNNVVMDEEEHQFVLTDNGQIVKKTVVNNVKQGSLKIIKVDESKNPLAGVKFEILDLNKNRVCVMETNAEGIAQSPEIEKGTYYYREIEVPQGILLDSSLHEFTVEYDGQNVIENVVNYYIRGQLKIYKLVEGTSTPLAGAKFEITNEDGEVVDTIVSDENGIALSKKLVYGTYYFVESEAPDGYIKDNNTYTFKVENEDIIEAVIYNAEERLPQTGGMVSSDMVIVLMVTIISLCGYGIIKALSTKED